MEHISNLDNDYRLQFAKLSTGASAGHFPQQGSLQLTLVSRIVFVGDIMTFGIWNINGVRFTWCRIGKGWRSGTTR